MAIAYLSIFLSTLAQIFFIHAISRIGPGRTGFFVNLVRVFGSGLAILLLSETQPRTRLICVALGIVIVELRQLR